MNREYQEASDEYLKVRLNANQNNQEYWRYRLATSLTPNTSTLILTHCSGEQGRANHWYLVRELEGRIHGPEPTQGQGINGLVPVDVNFQKDCSGEMDSSDWHTESGQGQNSTTVSYVACGGYNRVCKVLRVQSRSLRATNVQNMIVLLSHVQSI